MESIFSQLVTMLNTPWFYGVLTLLYGITVFAIIAIVISENRNPVKSLAWVTVLLLFPAGGILLYIFFGRSIKNARLISRRQKRRLRGIRQLESATTLPKHLNPDNRQQVQLARSLGAGGFYEGNDIRIFSSGHDKFEALKHDLRQAQKFIYLQYYIFEDDTIGRQIAGILMERALAGIRVRVAYDHVGSFHVRNRFFKEMREAGVEIYPFFKVVFPMFATRINWRNHRKLVIIDGKIGYIGGMNIADRYIDGGSFPLWRDIHARLTGPAVAALHYSFACDWALMRKDIITDESPQPTTSSPVMPGAGIQMLTSGPTDRWGNIELQFLKAISNAKKRIYIQTPYFLPPESLLRALQAAALARVDVRVMMPTHSDSRILTFASRSYITESVAAGIKIYLYDGGMLHSKVMIVDDDFSTIGSTNFDFRSFEHNFEGNIFIFSREVNAQLSSIFAEDMKLSRRVRASQWHHRPIFHRILESLMRPLSPIL